MKKLKFTIAYGEGDRLQITKGSRCYFLSTDGERIVVSHNQYEILKALNDYDLKMLKELREENKDFFYKNLTILRQRGFIRGRFRMFWRGRYIVDTPSLPSLTDLGKWVVDVITKFKSAESIIDTVPSR